MELFCILRKFRFKNRLDSKFSIVLAMLSDFRWVLFLIKEPIVWNQSRFLKLSQNDLVCSLFYSDFRKLNFVGQKSFLDMKDPLRRLASKY